jgi:hypothetical protein
MGIPNKGFVYILWALFTPTTHKREENSSPMTICIFFKVVEKSKDNLQDDKPNVVYDTTHSLVTFPKDFVKTLKPHHENI